MTTPLLPPSVRAVAFDAVGTLIVPTPPAAVVYAACGRRRGIACDEVLIRDRMIAAFQAEDEHDQAAGWITSEAREEERWRRIVAATFPEIENTNALFHELFEHFARPDSWAVNPDAADVLQSLAARGLTLALASNYDARLDRVLAGLPDLALVLSHVIISSQVGFRKPSTHFFHLLASDVGLEPHEVAYIGDDFENDYRGAAAAGLFAIHFDEHDRHDAARRIRRLRELIE